MRRGPNYKHEVINGLFISGVIGFLFYYYLLGPAPATFQKDACVEDTKNHRIYMITYLPPRIPLGSVREARILKVGDTINEAIKPGQKVLLPDDSGLQQVNCPEK